MIYEYTSWEGGSSYIRGRLEELEIARDNGRPRKKNHGFRQGEYNIRLRLSISDATKLK